MFEVRDRLDRRWREDRVVSASPAAADRRRRLGPLNECAIPHQCIAAGASSTGNLVSSLGTLALRLSRHDEVMNTHEIGAVRQKSPIGMPLIVGVTDRNPEHDFARLDRLREMRGVPGDEPMAERVVQAACA